MLRKHMQERREHQSIIINPFAHMVAFDNPTIRETEPKWDGAGKDSQSEIPDAARYERIKAARFQAHDLLDRVPGLPWDISAGLSQAVELYSSGFFKQSAVFATATIEGALKTIYGDKYNLLLLIEKAATQGYFTDGEKAVLHQIRQIRNAYVHDISARGVREDAELSLVKAVDALEKLAGVIKRS